VSTSEALPNIAASRGIEPEHLKRALRGDLDWVVMKALEKERSRRYETANGFAADILRHLSNEPVLAAPPSRAYRLRKFARKHRGPLAAAALVLLALVAGLIGTTWQAVRADRARRAEAERALAEAAAKREAQRVGEQLRSARDELWSSLYAAQANLIQNAWEAKNVSRVRELLGEQVPRAGQRDLRCFEWHYWDRLAHAELSVIPLSRFRGFGKFSPDGGTLLGSLRPDAGSEEMSAGMVGIWDAATGRLLRELKLYTAEEIARIGFLRTFNFTPDGSAFQQGATETPEPGAPHRTVPYFWDTAAGKRLHRMADLGANDRDPVLAGGNCLLWVTANPREKVKPTLRARDLSTGKDLYKIDLPADDVGGFSVSKGGDVAVLLTFSQSSKPAEVKIWSAADGKPLASCSPFEPPPSSDSVPWLVLSPDARRVAAGYRSVRTPQPLTAWDVSTGKALFRGQAEFFSDPVFSPDARLLAGISEGSVIEVRDATSGKLRHRFLGHPGIIWDVGFNADGTRLYSCGYDETIRIWDVTDAAIPDRTPLAGATGGRIPSATGGDGSRFATQAEPRPGASKATADTIAVWDLSGERLATVEATLDHKWHSDFYADVAMDRDGRRVAFADGKDIFDDGRNRPEGQLFVWDVATGKPLLARARWGRFLGCSLSPDGSRVASVFVPEGSSRGDPLTVWEVGSGRELRRLDAAHTDDGKVVFSPDGSRVVLSQYGSLRGPDVLSSWELSTGKKLWELTSPGLGQQFGLLVYSPDGRRVARSSSAIGGPGVVEVVDADTGRRVFTLRGHSGSVLSLRFSPDCRRIATSDLTEVKLWDAESGRALLDLKRPDGGDL
jgi:WD40 repeat protein